ncbi:kinase-like domain protein [Fusarium tjaetaba]|uniref:Kinase-like domain protein n=1 Tax=Fusarium tjaetaba TaxID=1567544 RepID=A0A8H5Q9U0_9HYPO|nr:kinase-like domain protein [Fusarium tjaetaba]KAF5611337.1 kinase-like domain protein [Fusarium tjaetaba]
MATTPRYSIEGILTNVRSDDHNARFSVRRNGKVFYITVSPTNFINSPDMTEKYMAYLEVLKSREEVIGDIYDTDVYEWVMAPFEPLLVELAPPPASDPQDIQITLERHLFPDFFVFELHVIDERLCPRRVAAEESPVRPSFLRFDDDFLDDLETWTAFYDPAGITLSFQDPEDALFKPPSKVLIDNRKTECFFKPCNSSVQTKRELETYKMIQAAGLDSKFNLCRVYGLVLDEYEFVLGVLLTYIDNRGCPLSTKIAPGEPGNPPPEVRQRWMDQIEAAVSGLHGAGIVWGDVKAENVLVDQDNNSWVTDFGGGYTRGWVDKEVAETMEGDRMGMEKLREFIFPATS